MDADEIERELEQQAVGDLELFDGAEFSDYEWTINRLRSREEISADPAGPAIEFWTKKVGPLDYAELARDCGGGAFELRGYCRINGNRVLKRKPIRRFPGPRLKYPGGPAIGAPDVPVQNGGDQLTQLMARMDARLDRLENNRGGGLPELVQSLAAIDALRSRQQGPPIEIPKAPTITELVAALQGLDGLRGGAAAPAAPADVVMTILQKGIAIGEGRGPVDDDGNKTDWGNLIASALQAFTSASETARIRRASPPPTANGHPPSGAEVVNDRGSSLTADEQRWVVLLEALERAIRLGEDPGTVATALEVVLPPIELEQLRKEPLTVLQRLTPLIDVRYPSLKGDASRNYVALVVTALQEEDSDRVTVDQGGNADPP